MQSLYERAEPWDVALGASVLPVSVVQIKRNAHGPRLLCLHGNPGTLADFAELARWLTFASELLLLDLPGFGTSAPAAPGLECSSLGALARIAMAVIDRAGGAAPVHVVGHSHGAGVAQAMAWAQSPRVASLVLLASLGYPAHAAYRQLAFPAATRVLSVAARCVGLSGGKALVRGVLKSASSKAFSPHPVPHGHIDRELAGVLRNPSILPTMAALAQGDPCAALAANAALIAAPTLFVHGDSDRLVPAAHARALHDLRLAAGGSSEFQVVRSAGHMLPITHAQDIAARIERWILAPRSPSSS
jgi:pyruvate dehydrogenase E2 component (dihydrolipoamide acetyltransferase)